MPNLILLRHGQSVWNKENRFTGWTDVELTAEGLAQARRAGGLLVQHGLDFDAIHTSYLRRAVRTLREVQAVTDRMWMPVQTDWRLNERHYGGLQGKDKGEMQARFGVEQVRIWSSSYATPPPPPESGEEFPDRRYAGVDVPRGESLKDTLARVMPCWEEVLRPRLQAGDNLLVVAHCDLLRALAKHLGDIGDDEIMSFEIPTGVPLVYELDANLRVDGWKFLED